MTVCSNRVRLVAKLLQGRVGKWEAAQGIGCVRRMLADDADVLRCSWDKGIQVEAALRSTDKSRRQKCQNDPVALVSCLWIVSASHKTQLLILSRSERAICVSGEETD